MNEQPLVIHQLRLPHQQLQVGLEIVIEAIQVAPPVRQQPAAAAAAATAVVGRHAAALLLLRRQAGWTPLLCCQVSAAAYHPLRRTQRSRGATLGGG